MIIPILMVTGGLYYSSRVIGWLVSMSLGGLILEGTLDSKEAARNYWIDRNPLRAEAFQRIQALRAMLDGKPIPPGYTIPEFDLFELTGKDLPESMSVWYGKYLLTPEERAQFMDALKVELLEREEGIGKEFADLCRKSGLDPTEIGRLCWPDSNSSTTDLHWFKTVSERRFQDHDILSSLVPEKN